MKKKNIFKFIFVCATIFLFSPSVFASIANDNQSVADTAFSSPSSDTSVSILQYNYNQTITGGVRHIDFKLSSTTTGGAVVNAYIGCSGCGYSLSSQNVTVTDAGIYRFNFPSQHTSDLSIGYFGLAKTSGQLTIWGSSTDTASGYAYYNGQLTAPAPLDLAYAINTDFAWVDRIITQTTPIPNSIQPIDVNFSGGFANASGADEIILGIVDVTEGLSSSYTHTVQPFYGGSEVYNFTQTLTANHEYLYTLQVHNSVTNAYSAITTPIGFTTSSGNATAGFVAPTYQVCDTDHLINCFENAFVYLVYPQTDVFNRFVDLANIIKQKPPIGYVYGVITTLGGLNTNSTALFSVNSMTGINTTTNPIFINIFNPIRVALSWILWIVFAVALFKRFQHLNI